MTQTLKKIISALVQAGTVDMGELYKIALDQTANWKPRPEPEEIEAVIKKCLDSRKLGMEFVRNWVNEAPGEFSLSYAYKDMDVLGKKLSEGIVRECLHRLVEKGVIVPAGKKRGVYRRVEKEKEPIDWMNAPTAAMDVVLPFNMHEIINIYPSNIVVVAGEKDSGKTAFMLDFVKHNMNKHVVNYFSSEMGETELKIRLQRHEDISLEEWNFKAWNKTWDFADAIVPNEINIIDFLEVDMERAYIVTNEMRHIYKKIREGGGLALLALQKSPYKDFGVGGPGTAEKARLYLTLSKPLEHSVGTVRILASKNWTTPSSPNGKIRHYNIENGARFICTDDWHYPSPAEKQARLHY